MKKWEIKADVPKKKQESISAIVELLLQNRAIKTKAEQEEFLHPKDPYELTPKDVDLEQKNLDRVLDRISTAITNNESIVVYSDYDADGITAGTVMWESLYALGARVMPYVPHRFDEGYGFSKIGIDRVKEEYHANLIISVDHGISGREKIAYAQSLGIDVIVTDHHTKPELLPECLIVHTTKLSGSGVSWFVAKSLLEKYHWETKRPIEKKDLVAIASIGIVADLVPLVGPSRSVVKYGLEYLNTTKRVGLKALFADAAITQGEISTYDISHLIAPRINASGRLEHALDALRLLCTKEETKALDLATKIGGTNRERQQLTLDTAQFSVQSVYDESSHTKKRILFVANEEFNQGIIGLVAGKLVEEFYLPAVVVTVGETHSKASARSISGFNIVEALRACQDLLLEVGGHPMAAGFTVETKNLDALQKRLEDLAEEQISDELLVRKVHIDCELPITTVTEELWSAMQSLAPFGVGNYEPVFASYGVTLWDVRRIGKEGKHVKFKVNSGKGEMVDAVAFGMGDRFEEILSKKTADIAYAVSMNEWNGNRNVQLLIRDIRVA